MRASIGAASLSVLRSNAMSGPAFHVQSTARVGGSYRGEPRPFDLELISDPDRIDMRMGLEVHLDQELGGELGLSAGCNSADDHRILAELAVWLASRFDAYVMLDGRLSCSPEEVKAMPGSLHRLDADLGHLVIRCDVADAAFLRGWLAQPAFHMIK